MHPVKPTLYSGFYQDEFNGRIAGGPEKVNAYYKKNGIYQPRDQDPLP
jgi:hypothetical protein